MASRRRNKFDRLYSGPLFITSLLNTLGILDLVATPIGLLIVLAVRVQGEQPLDAAFVGLLTALFIAGVTLGGGLLGFAALLRYGYVLARSRDAELQAPPNGDPPGGYRGSGEATEPGPPGSDRIAQSERDGASGPLGLWRELSRLAPPAGGEEDGEREAWQTHLQRRAAELIIDAINGRQLGKARVLLADAQACFGPTDRFEKLGDRVQQAARRNEPLDHARAKRLVEEAIADEHWSAAERRAASVTFDHPESTRCRHLWDSTRRARLQHYIQERSGQHHWAEALAAADEFLERFPDGPEAEALREQLPTLRDNAEILQRRQYETRFQELLAGGQYTEALRLARLVVERFPDSPQARALRDRIPLLEKRAEA